MLSSACLVVRQALAELSERLLSTQRLCECRLDCVSLAVLPSNRAVWTHLAPTLTVLSLNGNSLTELPAELGLLAALRRLSVEANLLRTLPSAVLELRELRELALGCNQLSG